MDTELQVLTECVVELGVVLGLKVHALLDDVLGDDLEDLVLLKCLRVTRAVEGDPQS